MCKSYCVIVAEKKTCKGVLIVEGRRYQASLSRFFYILYIFLQFL